MDSLTIITTLVATNARKNQIGRFLDYHQRFDCQIIVVAPDDLPVDKSNFDTNVELLRCPHTLGVLDKILLATNRIKTPYMAWIADDDFLGMDYAQKSIKILDSYENVAACDGLTVFQEEGTGKRKNHLYSYKNYKNGLNFQEIKISRDKIFRFAAENHNPAVIHGVMRTAVFKEAVLFNKRYNPPVSWTDYLFVGIILMHGKIQFIRSVANIRSFGTRTTENDPKIHHKPEVGITELIMDDAIVNALLDYYKKHKNGISATIKSEILYFIIRATRALKPYDEGGVIPSMRGSYLDMYKSICELKLLQFFNEKIDEDIKLSKKMMIEFNLKKD